AEQQRGEREQAQMAGDGAARVHRARLAQRPRMAIGECESPLVRKGVPMAMRSWLFVPGDSQVKLDKVAGLGADAVIVDLEDAVAPPAKPTARMLAKSFLEVHG